MAVEIPIYIDIKGAFDQAASEVPKQMPKLEKAISSQALKVQFDGLDMRTLLTGDLSKGYLKDALKDIRKEFEAVVSGAQKARRGMNVDNLIKSYTLLEQRVTGTYNKFTPMIMKTEAEIGKINAKIVKLQTTLSSSWWGSDAYNKANYELMLQKKRLTDVTAQLMRYKAGIDQTSSSIQKQSGLLKQFAGYFSGIYAATTVLRFVKQVRDVTGELEYQRVALGHLLGDVEFGNELFEKTIAAAKESPFRITQLVTYTKQLAAYRIEQDKLFETTQRLADISAGLGVDMNRLILAYGQVRAASVLRGQELRQFTEAGIPLVELLAEKFTKLRGEMVSTADVFKLISERAVPFEYIKDIFEDLTNAGGMFYKMQEEQAKTLKGRWEKLKDAYDQALMSIGDSSTFQSWNDVVLKVLNAVASHLKGIVRLVNAATIAWVTYRAVTSLVASDSAKLIRIYTKEIGVMGALKLAVGSLTQSWKKFVIALSSNWVGLALSAVAGLATYLMTFRNKVKDTTEDLSDMQRAIAKMKDANETLKYSKELIESYAELSKNTNRTAAENEHLATVMSELKRLFPEVASSIDNENVALDDQIERLNEIADMRKQVAIDTAKEQLDTQAQIIRGLEDEEAAAKAAFEAAKARKKAAEESEKLGARIITSDSGAIYYKSAKKLKEETVEAAKDTKTLEEAWEKAAIALADARKEAETLKNLINPKKESEWQAWADEIKKLQDSMATKPGDKKVFSDDDLKNFTSVYDMSKKLKKRIDDLTTSIAGMKVMYESMTDKSSKAAISLLSDIERDEALLNMANAIKSALGLTFKKSTKDTRLQDLKKDISEITNAYKKFLELKKYEGEDKALIDIDKMFPQLKGWVPTFEGTIKKLKEKLDEVQKKLNKSPKDKTLLDMQRTLETEISNLKVDRLKTILEEKIRQLSYDIKRTQSAKHFFDDLLGLTGDEQLASTVTMNVYGDTGANLKQKLQQELGQAFVLDTEELEKDGRKLETTQSEIRQAILAEDYQALEGYIKYVTKENRANAQQLLKDRMDANAEWFKDFYQTYQKGMETREKIDQIYRKRDQKKKEIDSRKDITDEKKTAMKKQVDVVAEEDVAKVELEGIQKTYQWTQAFKDLERVSTATLRSLIGLLDEWIKKAGPNATPEDMRTVVQAREQAGEQMISRNPYAGATNSAIKYINALQKLNKLRKEGKKGTIEYLKALDELKDATVDMRSSINAVGNSFNTMSSIVSSLSDILDLDELSDGKAVLSGIASGLTLVGTALIFINAMFTLLETNPIVLAISAIIAGVAALAMVLSNLSTVDAERQLQAQQKVVDALTESYDKLEDQMKKTFGADYIENYRARLENLHAQETAYYAQAGAERSKGKKADEQQAKDYEKAAREAAAQIEEMRTELSERFLGEDLTSAARSFAEAWVDAYKEFSSTTDALKDKFADMIRTMVVESLAAKVVEQQLKPIFDLVDELSREGGQLSTMDMARIASLTKDTVGTLNVGLTNLMNALSDVGLNVRTMGTGLTGISKDIQGASEESILGLAAGVNTQNFYMAQINANVIRIVELLGGESVAAAASLRASSMPQGETLTPYQTQVIDNLSKIPQMAGDMAAIRSLLGQVIKPKGVSTEYTVRVS